MNKKNHEVERDKRQFSTPYFFHPSNRERQKKGNEEMSQKVQKIPAIKIKTSYTLHKNYNGFQIFYSKCGTNTDATTTTNFHYNYFENVLFIIACYKIKYIANLSTKFFCLSISRYFCYVRRSLTFFLTHPLIFVTPS